MTFNTQIANIRLGAHIYKVLVNKIDIEEIKNNDNKFADGDDLVETAERF